MTTPNLQGLTLEEELLIYSWFYKLGAPLVSDQKFNFLYSKLKTEKPDSPLVLRTWSEIEEPTELLIKAGRKDLSDSIIKKNLEGNELNPSKFFMAQENMDTRHKYLSETRTYFRQFIPKSIDTIESEEQSDEWLKEIIGDDGEVEVSASLKIDGWFADVYYYKGLFIGAYTRGRDERESRDVSIALSHVVPMKINTKETYVAISIEAAMMKSSLEILRRMDTSREWKSHRNSMSTLLLNNLTKDFYEHIVPFGHGIKGMSFDSATEMYQYMDANGITPTPNMPIVITKTGELLNLIQAIGSMTIDIPSDGIVVRVNNTELYNSFDTIGKYDQAIRAYRLYEWKSDIYISMVTNLTYSYSAKNISLGLQILPTRINNGPEITNLDADNLDRLLRSGAKVGSLVAFHMRSDSCVDWLDFSTRYIEKCAEHQIPMDTSFIKAIEKFKQTLSEKLNINVDGAITSLTGELINQLPEPTLNTPNESTIINME